jgi:ubiquinone/menaquinone biosynthesis C-methylase UbiE
MANPAETYESYIVPSLFGPWADRTIRFAGPEAHDRVLDLACGTGIVARKVAAGFGSTGVGIDTSADMLSVARRAADRDGLDIEWHLARAEALPFGDESFDLALCQFGLMFFSDRAAALAETARVLKRGGRVVITTWQGLDRHPFYATLHDAIRRRIGISALETVFSLGDAAALQQELEDAGFAEVESEQASMEARFPDPDAFLAGEVDVDTAATPAMQRLDEGERSAIVDAIPEEMQAPLEALTEGRHVVIPFHGHLVPARAGRA